jgi:hypothetical protein
VAVIKNVERPDYVYIGSETEVLQRMLDHYRATLLWKCEGLDEEELRQQSVKPSELSLFELLRHLTDAERYWFQVCVAGRDLPRGFEPAAAPAADVLAHYLEACEESRQITAACSLDQVTFSGVYGAGGEPPIRPRPPDRRICPALRSRRPPAGVNRRRHRRMTRRRGPHNEIFRAYRTRSLGRNKRGC